MRMTHAALLVMLGPALAACTDLAPAPPTAPAAAALTLVEAPPLTLDLRCQCGNFDITPDPDHPWISHVVLRGICQGTHLGRASVVIDQHADFGARTLVGTETITAANGDQLRVQHFGTLTPLSPTRVDFGGPIEIVGGTGRFIDASGSGEFAGGADSAANIGFYNLTALIRYAASGRALP